MSVIANASLIFLSSMLMVGSMVMLLVPVAPVTLLLAVIASLAGLFTGFDPISVPALLASGVGNHTLSAQSVRGTAVIR
ncbi:MAG: hypothetical protein SNJ83_08550, partial [Aggregatilineales bacterium]